MAGLSRAAAWLRLLRVGNLPTVWSNVVMGVAVGAAATAALRAPWRAGGAGATPLAVLLNESFVLLLAGTLVYAGAVAMNDGADAAVDLRERPDRPVPSGAVTQRAALRAGKIGVVGGLALTVAYPRPAVVALGTLLALCVVLYNALHLRHAWAVAFPALCRGLLVATAVAVVPHSGVLDALVPAAVVAAAVLAVSLYARAEAERPGRPARVGWLLAGLPVLDAALCWVLAGNTEAAAFCLACGVAATLAGRLLPAS